MRKPDFENLLKVLARQKPFRPTLFEFIIGTRIFEHILGRKAPVANALDLNRFVTEGFAAAGYDYAVLMSWALPGSLEFKKNEVHRKESISLNEGFVVTDRKSFDSYAWPDPDRCDYSVYDDLKPHIPDGMKLIACG